MFLFDGAICKWQIPFLYLKKRLFTRAGGNCNKLKLFPWGPWERIASAAPAEANYLIRILSLDNHSV